MCRKPVSCCTKVRDRHVRNMRKTLWATCIETMDRPAEPGYPQLSPNRAMIVVNSERCFNSLFRRIESVLFQQIHRACYEHKKRFLPVCNKRSLPMGPRAATMGILHTDFSIQVKRRRGLSSLATPPTGSFCHRHHYEQSHVRSLAALESEIRGSGQ